jgi:modulator of FtsH protease HflC
MKRNPITITIGVLLLLIFGLLLVFYQVRTTEVAMVTTFGKPTRPVTQPGAYPKWPWPIQQVYKFDKRIQNFESKFEQVFTADGHSLMIKIYAGWNITEPQVFFPKFGDSVLELEKALSNLARSAYSGVVGTHSFSDFISTDEKQLKFEKIEQEILELMQKDVRAKGYGVEVKFVGIKRIGLPESVTKLVFERMQAERQLQVRRIEEEGRREASNIRSAANTASQKVLAEADYEAANIRGEGDKQAAASLRVFEQEPELGKFLVQLRALEDFLKDRTTLILDTQTFPLNLLNGGPSSSPAPSSRPRTSPNVQE